MDEARKIQEAPLKKGTAVAQAAIGVSGLLALARTIAEGQGDDGFATLLTDWKADLEGLKTNLTTLDGLTGLRTG